MLIGSGSVERKRCDNIPLAKRPGMRLFSAIVGLLTGQVVYDTSSGLKIIHRRVSDVLAIAVIGWLFDLVRLDRLYVGYSLILAAVILAGAVFCRCHRFFARSRLSWGSSRPRRV